MNHQSDALFSGQVVRYEVKHRRQKLEVFYLLLSFEKADRPGADHFELDRFSFFDQPKTGPALVYLRELSQDEALILSPNSYSSVMDGKVDPAPGPHGRKYLGENVLTSYEPQYIEMVWGFTDEIWDGPRNEWYAARTLVEQAGSTAEAILLVNEATSETARSAVREALDARRARVLSEIEVERTFLIRPGLGTPPIYYVKPARVG